MSEDKLALIRNTLKDLRACPECGKPPDISIAKNYTSVECLNPDCGVCDVNAKTRELAVRLWNNISKNVKIRFPPEKTPDDRLSYVVDFWSGSLPDLLRHIASFLEENETDPYTIDIGCESPHKWWAQLLAWI